MISDRKDRVSNKFYSWIFMIAGDFLRFMIFLYLGFAPKIHTESWGAKLWQRKKQILAYTYMICWLKLAFRQTHKAGFPEYTAVVGDFVLVMEDKADRANLCLKEADGTISMTAQTTTDYLHHPEMGLQSSDPPP